jgi:hypothetical protein
MAKPGPKPRHGYRRGPDGLPTPTYYSWREMKRRCTDTKGKAYETYSGKLSDRWRSFDAFLEDMGERPEGTTLDRVDGTLGYTKENCRWATWETQMRNRAVTKLSIESAREMRHLHTSGVSMRKLGQLFGVSYPTARSVVRGELWREDV